MLGVCGSSKHTVAVGPSVLCVLYAVLRLWRRAVGPGVRHTPQCLSLAAPALGPAWPWSPRLPHLHERRMDLPVQPGAYNLMSNRKRVLYALMILVAMCGHYARMFTHMLPNHVSEIKKQTFCKTDTNIRCVTAVVANW